MQKYKGLIWSDVVDEIDTFKEATFLGYKLKISKVNQTVAYFISELHSNKGISGCSGYNNIEDAMKDAMFETIVLHLAST